MASLNTDNLCFKHGAVKRSVVAVHGMVTSMVRMFPERLARFTLDTVLGACFEVDEHCINHTFSVLSDAEARGGRREVLVLFGADLAISNPLRFRVLEVAWYDRWPYVTLPRCSLDTPLHFTTLGSSVARGCFVAVDDPRPPSGYDVARVQRGALCSPLLCAFGHVLAVNGNEFVLDTVRCVFRPGCTAPLEHRTQAVVRAASSSTQVFALFHSRLGQPATDEIPRVELHYVCVPSLLLRTAQPPLPRDVFTCGYDLLHTLFTCASPLAVSLPELVLPPPPVWNGRADGFVCAKSGIVMLRDRPELFRCPPELLADFVRASDSPVELHLCAEDASAASAPSVFHVYRVTRLSPLLRHSRYLSSSRVLTPVHAQP